MTTGAVPAAAIMALMAKVYVEERNGGYYLAGSRVSLDSVVQCESQTFKFSQDRLRRKSLIEAF